MAEVTTYEPYQFSDEEQIAIKKHYDQFQHCVNERQVPRHYFDDMTYEEVINESVKVAISYLPPRVEGEWKHRVSMPDVEQKIQTMMSFAAQQRLRSEISARSKGETANKNLSVIVSALNEKFLDIENFDEKFIDAFYELLIKPLAIVYEGYEYRTRETKDLTEYNFETGAFDFKKRQRIDIDRPNARVVPCENFYFPDFYQPDLQKQQYVYEREEMPYTTAEAVYGKYPNWKYVQTKNSFTEQQKESNFYFYQNWNGRVESENVEVLHGYNREEDTYNIIVNGIPLNSIDSPIIFDHKDYPYSWAKAQKYAVDFAPGKPLTIKLLKLKEISDTLINMFLDRTYFSVLPFWFTGFEDEIEDNTLRPGGRVQVPNVDQMKEGNVQAVQQGDLSMHGLITDAINRSSVDPAQEGEVSGETATAIQMAREAAVRAFTLTLNFMMWMEKSRTRQRVSNIIQFYPKHTMIKQATGEFEVTKKEIRREQAILSDGSIGLQIIRLVDPKEKPITQSAIQEEVDETKEKEGVTAEIYYTTPAKLANIEFDVRIVPNSSIAETESMQKAMFVEGAQFILQSFPQLVGQAGAQVLYEEALERFKLPKEKILRATSQEQEAAQTAPGGQGQGLPPELMQALAGQGQGPQGASKGQSEEATRIPSRMRQMVGSPAKSTKQLQGMRPV
jgi:hypothetical protein